MRLLAALAGHSHISTTQRYIDVNSEQLSEAVELLCLAPYIRPLILVSLTRIQAQVGKCSVNGAAASCKAGQASVKIIQRTMTHIIKLY